MTLLLSRVVSSKSRITARYALALQLTSALRIAKWEHPSGTATPTQLHPHQYQCTRAPVAARQELRVDRPLSRIAAWGATAAAMLPGSGVDAPVLLAMLGVARCACSAIPVSLARVKPIEDMVPVLIRAVRPPCGVPGVPGAPQGRQARGKGRGAGVHKSVSPQLPPDYLAQPLIRGDARTHQGAMVITVWAAARSETHSMGTANQPGTDIFTAPSMQASGRR